MKRRLIYAAVVALVLAGLFAALRREETTSLLSPDQRLRAVLLDRPHFPSIDRNFVVRIEETEGVSRKVFMSPDESPTGIGSERFLWSKDSKRLLLVGKRFWVREGVQLESGEFLYFLYDVPSGQVWCNSDRQGPPFGPNELAGYDFGESLTLKPVAQSNEQPQSSPSADR
jgi:hypothetical protein